MKKFPTGVTHTKLLFHMVISVFLLLFIANFPLFS